MIIVSKPMLFSHYCQYTLSPSKESIPNKVVFQILCVFMVIVKTSSPKIPLSHDVAVIQWITSCHVTHMTTHAITLQRIHVMSLTTSV